MNPNQRKISPLSLSSYRAVIAGACAAAAALSGCGSSSSKMFEGMGGATSQTAGAGASARAGSPAANAGASGHDTAGEVGDGGSAGAENAGAPGQGAGAAGLADSAGAGGGSAGAGGRSAGAGGRSAGAAGSAGSGGAAGATGGATSVDPQCKAFESLALSDFRLTKAAVASGTAEFTATLTNLSDKFIDYTAGVLTCKEQGTLVDSVNNPNWSFGIVAKGTQSLTFSAKLNATAPSGATIHCAAHAAQLSAQDCGNASQQVLEFKVQ